MAFGSRGFKSEHVESCSQPLKLLYLHNVYCQLIWKGCKHIMIGPNAKRYMILQSHGIDRSRNKLTMLYLHLHESNKHQIKPKKHIFLMKILLII